MNTPFIVNKKQRAILADNSFNPNLSKEGKNIREGLTLQNLLDTALSNTALAKCYGLNPKTNVYIEVREFLYSRDVCGNRTAHYAATLVLDDGNDKSYNLIDIVGSGSKRQQVGYGNTNSDAEYSLSKLGYPIELLDRSEGLSGDCVRYTYKIVGLETVEKLLDVASGNLYYVAVVEGFEIKAPLYRLIDLKIKGLVSKCRDASRKFSVTVSRVSGNKTTKVTRLSY